MLSVGTLVTHLRYLDDVQLNVHLVGHLDSMLVGGRDNYWLVK